MACETEVGKGRKNDNVLKRTLEVMEEKIIYPKNNTGVEKIN
jgi:hypothetical protein